MSDYPQDQYQDSRHQQSYGQSYGQQQWPPSHSPNPPYGQGYPPPAAPYGGDGHSYYHQPPPGERAPSPYGGYPPQQHQFGSNPPPYGQEPRQSYNSSEPYGQQSYPPYDNRDPYAQPPAHYGAPPANQDYYNQGPPAEYAHAPGAPPPAEGERGLMGALAGGAAGGYGGHKMGHGLIGGLAGAYAGHKLEDGIKEKKKKKKNKQDGYGRRGSSSSSSSSSSDDEKKRKSKKHSPIYAGNFSASSKNVYLDGNHDLVAECADPSGRHHFSRFNLDWCITNNNGRLEWAQQGKGNFSHSSKHVKLDRGNGSQWLEAELNGLDGHYHKSKICLDERIGNSNGRLEYVQ
ncbi:MAG: hypothetical protein M1820_002702 [Bogoriella megaspora]|nr:MAG: hypothetical protein M1820_002702 [Bogoriella megaspora]